MGGLGRIERRLLAFNASLALIGQGLEQLMQRSCNFVSVRNQFFGQDVSLFPGVSTGDFVIVQLEL